jgi:hypothetical protein
MNVCETGPKNKRLIADSIFCIVFAYEFTVALPGFCLHRPFKLRQVMLLLLIFRYYVKWQKCEKNIAYDATLLQFQTERTANSQTTQK